MTTIRPTPQLLKAPSAANSYWKGGLLVVATFGASAQSDKVEAHLRGVEAHRDSTAFHGIKGTLPDQFRRLSEKWRVETSFLSSSTAIAMHPAYQEIIGMGKEVLPMILEDLRRTSDHWFWALKSITGADPVPASDRGKIDEMKAAWLRWGGSKGLVTE